MRPQEKIEQEIITSAQDQKTTKDTRHVEHVVRQHIPHWHVHMFGGGNSRWAGKSPRVHPYTRAALCASGGRPAMTKACPWRAKNRRVVLTEGEGSNT